MTAQNKEPETVEYQDGKTRPAHSIFGASGAERWMNCRGSSALIAAAEMPQTDEPDFQREGIAGHEAAAECLTRDIDAWEIVGETFHNTEIDGDMAEAIQVYLDAVRPCIEKPYRHRAQFFVEAKLAAPDIHEQMFGTTDFGAIVQPGSPAWKECGDGAMGGFLDVTDLKMGKGIVVEPDDNPQLKYYAFMLIHTYLDDLDDDFLVRLRIVQPRAYHNEGPIREWWTTVGEIKAWVVRELLPAMNSIDDALDAGPWCRFCPAKLTCPLLTGLFKAAASYDPKAVVDACDQALGLNYSKIPAVKFYLKALEDETFRRLQLRREIPGAKLVNKKADRIYRPTVTVQVEGKDVEVDTAEYIKQTFGKKAYKAPEIMTPAQLEKIDHPAAKDFVKGHAYIPVTGLTVAPSDDKRIAVKMPSLEDRVGADTLANLMEEANAEK